jgi:hypothetical protein
MQLNIDSHCPLLGALTFAPSPLSTLEILLENGADPNQKAAPNKNTKGRRRTYPPSAVRQALRWEDSYRLIELLIKYGADTDD